MTTQYKSRLDADIPGEDAVCAFLTAQPEFFERHPELLDALRLPHRTGGAAVSLIERQMEQLRERNVRLERQLRELIAIARDNETLVEKLHGLALQLLGTGSVAARLGILEAQLRENFAVDQAVLVLFGDPAHESTLAAGRFLRVRASDDVALQPFATLLETGNPRCGQIRDSQRDFLFGADTNEIGSAALVPLMAGRKALGLLALGSRERDHFNPGKGTDVLRRIADTVAASIRLD